MNTLQQKMYILRLNIETYLINLGYKGKNFSFKVRLHNLNNGDIICNIFHNNEIINFNIGTLHGAFGRFKKQHTYCM